MAGDIIIENRQLRLTVGADCIVKSLVCKATGEECAAADEVVALFSVTQERPFNNEVKLSHPNKRTTYQGNSLRREGDALIVGFEIAPYKARIRIRAEPDYIGFDPVGFIVSPADYGHLAMDYPPAAVLRLAQLPVRHRARFGEWLNVVWDDSALVRGNLVMFLEFQQEAWGSTLVATGTSGILLYCLGKVKSPFEL